MHTAIIEKTARPWAWYLSVIYQQLVMNLKYMKTRPRRCNRSNRQEPPGLSKLSTPIVKVCVFSVKRKCKNFTVRGEK